MSGETVLIAAFSGRSLAQSARRAGYRPLVADAFGDLDTQDAAEDFRVLDGAMQTGFRTKPLIAALDDLSRSASTKPIGLVLGSGFEDKPRLVAALASRFNLLGSGAATYKACKDPQSFFGVLDRLGIPHPETQTSPPADTAGWITKRVGGSGGRHIRHANAQSIARPRRYFQKLLKGERISACFVGNNRASWTYLSRQWCAPARGAEFRYGGAVTLPPSPSAPEHQKALEYTGRVASELGLKGVASFDYIVANNELWLLEVNPRPGATFDIFDDADGHLFQDHVDAVNGSRLQYRDAFDTQEKAAAILHADRWPIFLNDIAWPDWAADRGPPGTFIPLGAPLATAFAEAPTADAAEALARKRLAELEDLIYGHAKS
ncbi:ATP-grasp domain-containing protein [Hyphomicrobium sp. ghe19]|uniref:ATP-grasp domain-containing protein n=1 Tax=Hyphomicrobium sp. ghe19 TaxID=2682968 RepID=UPI0013672F2A|nr:Carbamoyl-phosphate synthase arginine-specific large chain [Hyphomicrobium sp. ghe19]